MPEERNTAYTYRRVQVDCGATEDNPGRTIQSDVDGCDINLMMETFQKTGEIPQTVQLPAYGDFSNAVDYMDAAALKLEADNLFNALPAKIRSKFQNNPAELLAFMEDENNIEEATKLGLIRPDLEDQPVVEQQSDPPASETPSE